MPQIFAEPGWLWLLVLLFIGALVVGRGTGRRRSEWRALGLNDEPPSSGVWSWWLAACCAILALAAPRWGREPGSEPPPGHDVVFLVDVSRSMGAEDAVPDRLGLATMAARSLVEQFKTEPGDRAAVVAFTGRAVVQCPLTVNLDVVTDRLAELRPGSIEPGGTNLGAGLAVALDVFGPVEHAAGRSIVVFSDGEDHAGTWPTVVERLVKARVPIHVVAVGDPDKPAPVPTSLAGPISTSTLPPTPRLPTMTTRSDVALTQLAHATGGASIPLGVAQTDLGALYRDTIRPTDRASRPGPRFSERAARASVCLSAGLAVGVWGSWPQTRRRRFRAGFGWYRRTPSWGRWLVLGVIALILVLTSIAATPPTLAFEAAAITNRGLQAYREARFAAAVTAFETVTAQAPANPVGPFDAGAALYALGQYPEAVVRYALARELAEAVADHPLIRKIDYALGNCSAMQHDFPAAVHHYDACLANSDPRSEGLPVQRDAAINRAFILSRLVPPPDPPAPKDSNEGQPGDSQDSARSNREGRRSPQSQRDNTGLPTPNEADADSSGSRGLGGAGGSGAALPESDSPEQRLDAAVRKIKAAREKRPAEPPPTPKSTIEDRSNKDW